MDLCLLKKIKTIPNPFQKKYQTEPEKKLRVQKAFNTMTFLMTMVQMVSSTNGQGYSIALNRVFRIQRNEQPPTKSTFSKVRGKISWRYFAKLCENLLTEFKDHRPTFEGMRVYAIDGFMTTLPKSQDINDHNFFGRWVSSWRRSYYPKAFIVHCYDVLSGVTRAVTFNPTLNENYDAYNIIKGLEAHCLVLYDRLYFSQRLVKIHDMAQNFFIARCKTKSNKIAKKLLLSKRKSLIR